MKHYMSFDLGGTNIKYAVVNDNAEIIEKGKIATPKRNLDELIALIEEITNRFKEKYEFKGVAMSCPGAVDNIRGIIGGSSAIPYIHGPNMRELIQEKTGLRVSLENDANCAALAEVWKGVAKNVNDVLFVVCGTGVGGSIIKNKTLHTGQHLHGGEFGYMIMDKDFEKGIFKTLSDTGSTHALIKKAAELKGILPEELNGEMVFKLAEENDEACKKAIDSFFMYLATGIYNLQYMYDPEMIVIGGAISARDDIVEEINKRLDIIMKNITYAKVYPRVERCAYLNDANILGAVYNFMSTFEMK